MRDYTKILAWQKADDLTIAIYEVTRLFPKEELYAMTSQLRRAAYSTAANLVEGATRGMKRDYLHFLHIARGSLSEVRYFIHLSARLKYVTDSQRTNLMANTDETLRILCGLIKAVESEAGLKSNVSGPRSHYV